MDITIHWDVSTNGSAKKDEQGIPYKYRLGAKPTNLQQTMKLSGLSGTINLGWKKHLTKLIGNRQFRNSRATVYVGSRKYTLSGRNPQTFANNLANLLLMDRRSQRNNLGVATKESTLALVK